VTNTNFQYSLKTPVVLENMDFVVERGSRVLVLGANGAGKSTLFRLLAGKHMHSRNDVLVLGQSAFFETPRTVAYLGSDWRRSVAGVGNNVPYHGDFTVNEALKVLGQTNSKEDNVRIEKLVDLLEINLEWRMHQISDGQIRRVQIMIALMKPFDVLLLDEITVDLDVLSRMNLLNFLKEESEKGCTIMYATHIFDGIDMWPTHLMRIEQRKVNLFSAETISGPLYLNAAKWLQEERDFVKTNRPK